MSIYEKASQGGDYSSQEIFQKVADLLSINQGMKEGIEDNGFTGLDDILDMTFEDLE